MKRWSITKSSTITWQDYAWTHLVCEIEVWVHLDHLPAAVSVLIDSYEEAGVVLLPPLNVKVCCLWVAWNHIPTPSKYKSRFTCSNIFGHFSLHIQEHVTSLDIALSSGNNLWFSKDLNAYFFLSSGSAGMALWSGANSSSWEITSLAFTWTPEILNVGPFTFPLLPPGGQTRKKTSLGNESLYCSNHEP